MTDTSWLWDLAAWLSLPILVLLAALVAWRKLHREFPFFFAYVLIACLVGVVRFVVYKELPRGVYFYVYWCSDIVVIVATFLALYEIFLRRIFPGFSKVRLYRYLFPIAGGILAVVAFSSALVSPNKAAAFFITSRVFDLLRSAAVGFFVALILLMGRKFSGYEFGVACGFGLQAAVTLAISAIRTRANYNSPVLDRFEPIVYDISCVIWFITFWKPAKRTQFVSAEELDPAMLQQARTWETQLRDWIIPGKSKRS